MADGVLPYDDVIEKIKKDHSFSQDQATKVYQLGYLECSNAVISGKSFHSRATKFAHDPDEYYVNVYGPKGYVCTVSNGKNDDNN